LIGSESEWNLFLALLPKATWQRMAWMERLKIRIGREVAIDSKKRQNNAKHVFLLVKTNPISPASTRIS
jgi:hypothetical protein